MSTDSAPEGDIWSEWLLHRRHADDPQWEPAVRQSVERYADRVLDNARLAPGMQLLDVGTGDGLVGLRAIARVGFTLQVQMTDISERMLRHAEQRAVELGVREQCKFLRCGADQLDGIGDETVDVVTTRAVLAYIADKGRALREFLRVLKPGGRVSLCEPVFQDDAFSTRALKTLLESRPTAGLHPFMPLLHRWKAAQYPDTAEKIRKSPIANYSERDLIRVAQGAGFKELHLELHIDVIPSPIPNWEAFLKSSPHPLAPPLSIILAEQFSVEERQLFETVMRPVVEDPRSLTTDRAAYLTACKPAA
jgi:ubiquinone/menaquinone biosynthesis C-methylase UbiE